MKYIVILAIAEGVDDSVEVIADDFEIDAETRSILFYNRGADEDTSVAYFPLDKVTYVNVRKDH